MQKVIRFLLSGVLCTAVMISTVTIVNGKSNLAATTYGAGNLRLVAKECNVRFVISKSSQIKYDYDKSKFSITTSGSGSTTNITANKKSGVSSGDSRDMINIYIPNKKYDTIAVDSDNAGVSLPELNVNFNLTSKHGSMSVSVPVNYNKTIKLNMINGSGSMDINQSDKNFRVSLISVTSAGVFAINLKNSALAISNVLK